MDGCWNLHEKGIDRPCRRELIDLVEGKIELIQFDKDPRIKRTNKSESISEMVLNLNERDTKRWVLVQFTTFSTTFVVRPMPSMQIINFPLLPFH